MGVRCHTVNGTCHVVAMEVPLALFNTSLKRIVFDFLASIQSAITIQDNLELEEISLPLLQQQSGRLYLACKFLVP
jgi:hypothetical protein